LAVPDLAVADLAVPEKERYSSKSSTKYHLQEIQNNF
jgi:hypothetical protein